MYYMTVFDDPTISTDTVVVELPIIAASSSCTLTGRTFSSVNPDNVMHAAAICLRSGFKVSNMWCS